MSESHSFAIVGMACRFPGADDIHEFWEMLCAGKCALEPTPSNRMRPARFGGYVRDVDAFDPLLFGVSPAEAAFMDPQQRKLLEVSFECMQDAGIQLNGTNTGVFIGAGMPDHCVLTVCKETSVGEYSATSSALSILANRISYVLDLSGPSMVVDTACSSSGAALATGLAFARASACDMLLVGGANYVRNPGLMRAFECLGVTSPTDGCKPFSADADGYARSEGVGVILLKRLDAAERDGNRIYAVVHDAHANEDGRNESMTMPNGERQRALLMRGYSQEMANDLAYVEMHGTGTSVGDPIEAGAMSAFLRDMRCDRSLPIGSVKSNIGHMECAATIGGIIKVALMAFHRTLVPSIKCATPSPKIDWTRMHVQQSVEPLPTDCWLGVNSFGFGGSNVHVVMRTHVADRAASQLLTRRKTERVPVVIGADSEASLRRMMAVGGHAGALCRRSQLHPLNRPFRLLAFDVGSNAPRGAEYMTVVPTSHSSRRPTTVFVFPGQGSQHVDMGRVLYRNYPAFASEVDRVVAAYHRVTGINPIDDIDMFRGACTTRSSAVNDIDYSLICLFAHQVALLALVRTAGVQVDVVVGHSVGELAAAYASGMADLETMMRIVAARTRIMKRHDGLGGMMAVSEPPCILHIPDVWVACYNSTTDVTLGGTNDALESVAALCRAERKFHKRLDVTNAYHTPLLGRMEQEMRAALDEMEMHPPTCVCYSTVTGTRVINAHSPEYFWENVISPVQFAQTIHAIRTDFPDATFVECGTHPVLRKYIGDMCGGAKSVALGSRAGREDETILLALVELQRVGLRVDWEPFGDGTSSDSAPPMYAYDAQTFAVKQHKDEARLRLAPPVHPLLHECVFHRPDRVLFKTHASTACIPFLSGHMVQNVVVVPAAMFVELALAASVVLSGLVCPRAFDIVVVRALPLIEDAVCYTEVTLDGRIACVHVFTEEFGTHYTCRVEAVVDPRSSLASNHDDGQMVEVTDLYDMFAEVGLHYDENFKLLTEVRRGDANASAVLDSRGLDVTGYHLHPCVLDDMFHAAFAASFECSAQFLPSRLALVEVYRTPPSRATVRAILVDETFETRTYDVALYDDTGAICVLVAGFECVRNGTVSYPVPDLCYKSRYSLFAPDVELDEPNYADWSAQCDALRHEWLYLGRRAATSIARHVVEHTAEPDAVSMHAIKYRAVCDAYAMHIGTDATCVNSTEPSAAERTLSYVEQHLTELRTNPGAMVGNVFHDGGYADLYRDDGFFGEAQHLVPIVAALVRANPTARILEIGSGTGGLTRRLVPHLNLAQCTYTYSDVSSYFLDTGMVEFGDKLQYKKVDINEPFGVGEYDLIVGLDVVHAVPDIARVLRNLHDALDTNGRIAIVDFGAMPWAGHLMFGVFAGWFQDGRSECFLKPSAWRTALVECGFDDVHTRSERGVDSDECFAHILLTARRTQRDVWSGNTHELLARIGRGESCPAMIRILDDDNVTEALTASLTLEGHAVRAVRAAGAPRLLPYIARYVDTSHLPFRAECGTNGQTHFRRFTPPPLGHDEVVVTPVVSSLNFKDVVIANGLVQIDAPIGMEMGGIVARIGAGVLSHRVGDRVYGFCTSGAFSNYAVAPATLLHASDDLRSDVSTLTPYCTAWYALVDRVRVTAGMRVLVHAACGALGLAAIQVCRLHGCTVVATAGSDAKRQYLLDMGIAEVFSSREPLPKECKVDVVVSALAGDYVYDGLRALRDGGHFVDVSKKDMLDDAPLRRGVLLKNVSYHSVHLDILMRNDHETIAKLMETVAGLPTKPMPIDCVFPLSRLEDAMAYMARGVHVGKIMIEHDDVAQSVVDAPKTPLRADETVVVTGGLGEMGMYLVDRMVSDGARYFILTTRSGARTRRQSIALRRLEARGAHVHVATVDARYAAPTRPEWFPSIGVVLHMAMVLIDKRAEELSEDDVATVWDTKVGGYDVIRAAYAHARIICFSSVASICGNYAQTAYAAANARLETYATTHARTQVLHVCAIDDCGSFAHDLGVRRACRAKGIAVDTSVRDVYTALRVLLLDAQQLQIVMCSQSHAMLNYKATSRAAAAGQALLDEADIPTRVREIVCATLQLPDARYDEDTPWVHFGADSLASVTLANKVNASIGSSITQMDILGLLTTRAILSRLGRG